ncbi:MAG: hypothetical protein COX57_11250 [Alphaproteobacteria bacterium CG_4_10_14_0_2_um_filter_63_37]|nr:MAG: hypothetical protein COX57_11250 [Alphaproteobacteria bacterium CG_4_10_14_0_2_um_filter_63_37]
MNQVFGDHPSLPPRFEHQAAVVQRCNQGGGVLARSQQHIAQHPSPPRQQTAGQQRGVGGAGDPGVDFANFDLPVRPPLHHQKIDTAGAAVPLAVEPSDQGAAVFDQCGGDLGGGQIDRRGDVSFVDGPFAQDLPGQVVQADRIVLGDEELHAGGGDLIDAVDPRCQPPFKQGGAVFEQMGRVGQWIAPLQVDRPKAEPRGADGGPQRRPPVSHPPQLDPHAGDILKVVHQPPIEAGQPLGFKEQSQSAFVVGVAAGDAGGRRTQPEVVPQPLQLGVGDKTVDPETGLDARLGEKIGAGGQPLLESGGLLRFDHLEAGQA